MNEQLIFRADSKALGVCNHVRLFEGEKNIDYLTLLIPQTYNGINLRDCDCALTYITPDGNENSFLINNCLQNYLYKELLVYQINIDERLTSLSGEIILYLTFTNSSDDKDVVLKTSTATIHIDKHPSGNHNITEEQKDIIAEILLRSKKALDIAKSIEERANDGEFQGEKGEKGNDGYSPTVSILNITNGHKIEIQDINGVKSFSVMDGDKGERGDKGEQGNDGIGISNVLINDIGELESTFSNGTTVNLGKVVGKDGKAGLDGKSAFELYQIAHPEYVGTYVEWLDTLKGEPGDKGEPGIPGKDYILTDEDKGDISSLTIDDSLESSKSKTWSIEKIKNEFGNMSMTQDELNEILDSSSPIMTEDELVVSLINDYVGGGDND